MEKIDSVAGPDKITQIGESVHRSAMEGGDAIPDRSRSYTKASATPSSFKPDYTTTKIKTAADVAEADFKAKGDAINAAAAKKAADAADEAAAETAAHIADAAGGVDTHQNVPRLPPEEDDFYHVRMEKDDLHATLP